MFLINISQFTADNSAVQASAKMSHHVTRGMICGSAKTWICKAMGTAEDRAQRAHFLQKDNAQRELLAQEFFRLIIPHQPETRVAHHPDSGDYFILSEEVRGYRQLPKNHALHFENSTYTGLGQALLCAMFVEEVDLKNGNIGLDHQNRVIKIDGNLSFSSRTPGHSGLHNMADDLISTLPYPKHFFTFNWLDYVKKRVKYPTSHIVDSTLRSSPQFRQEINQAILKICLLPDDLLDGFINACVPERKDEFMHLIKSRRDRLQALAMQNTSFQSYLSTAQAQHDVQDLIWHLLCFKAQGQLSLCDSTDKRFGLACTIMDRAISMRLSTPSKQAIIAKSATLLKKINSHRVPETDPLLDEFIYTKMDEICNNETNEDALSTIDGQLTAMLASMDSSEIADVNQTILTLADAPSTCEKASHIATAFRAMPLAERSHVISTHMANPVQQELARHRFFPHTGMVYFKDNQIDTYRAATAFTTLKAKYAEDVGSLYPGQARF